MKKEKMCEDCVHARVYPMRETIIPAEEYGGATDMITQYPPLIERQCASRVEELLHLAPQKKVLKVKAKCVRPGRFSPRNSE